MTRRVKKKPSNRSTQGAPYLFSFLVLLSIYLMLLTVKLSHAPVLRAVDLIPIGMILVSFLAVRLLFRIGNYQGDVLLPPLALLLSGFGLLLQYRMGLVQWTDWTRVSLYAYPMGWTLFMIIWLLFRGGRHLSL